MGFSLAKLIVLAAIVAAVWYVFKAIGRRNEAPETKVADEPRGESRITAEDTVQCPHCGTYVVPREAKNCGRTDCPYPG